MELCIPGGASFTSAAFETVGQGTGAGDAIVAAGADLTPAKIDEVLATLEGGEIEYLSLTNGPAILQAAGEGQGPYQIQHILGEDGEQITTTDGASLDDVRRAFVAYVAEDPTWSQPFVWQRLDVGPAPRERSGGGFLKKLFGKL